MTTKINTTTFNEILKEAFTKIYPEKIIPKLTIKFSSKFSDYNANVKIQKIGRTITGLEFGLSRSFYESDDTIIKGLIQGLLNKVYKTNISTMDQDLYLGFIKHIGKYVKTEESDELLIELFNEINEEYFSGLMDQPTMIIGNKTLTILGNYNFHKDLVTISNALLSDRNLLKYVLYHELLHKKHSFKTKNGRGQYHTPAFRAEEKLFKDKDVEKKLNKFVKYKRIKKAFFG